MTEHLSKTILLNDMQKGYTDFEALLSSLSEQQMTTAGVNGKWSVKDNLAHLIAWQGRTLNLLQAIRQGVELPDPTPSMTEEQINEKFYQENKFLPLDKVLTDFRSTYSQMVNAVQMTSEEDLNKPISWLDDRPVVVYIVGNTYEHYQEHGQIIQDWLANSSRVK